MTQPSAISRSWSTRALAGRACSVRTGWTRRSATRAWTPSCSRQARRLIRTLVSVGALRPTRGPSWSSTPCRGSSPRCRCTGSQRGRPHDPSSRPGRAPPDEASSSPSSWVPTTSSWSSDSDATALAYAPRLEPFGLVPLEAAALWHPPRRPGRGRRPRDRSRDGVTGLLADDVRGMTRASTGLLATRRLRSRRRRPHVAVPSTVGASTEQAPGSRPSSPQRSTWVASRDGYLSSVGPLRGTSHAPSPGSWPRVLRPVSSCRSRC